MKSSSRVAMVGIVGGSLWLGACGHPGTAVTPKDIAVKDALGAKGQACATDKPKAAKPIIVDLDEDARTELESAMKKGVVVVAYDCSTIKVLRNCHVGEEATAYEYGGVDPKEKVVSVMNADELSVNVPMSSGKLGAEVKNGRNIDIAMIFRGQKTSTFENVQRTNLKSTDPTSCEGATHFIRQATIGAFAVVSGANGKASAAAEVFKVGASGSSEASRKALSHDGSLDACKGAAQDGESPVENCRSPLVLELQPILGEPPKQEAKKDPNNKDLPPPEAEASPCPNDYVFAQGKCMRANAQVAHTCEPTDEKECRAQCGKGSAESCFNVGAVLYKKDKDAAYPFLEKACDGDVTDACGYQAEILSKKAGLINDDAEAGKKIERVASKGCDGGSGLACAALGRHYDIGTGKDLKKARRSFRRACIFGETDGCWHAADAYRESESGIEPDFAQALEYGKRGCGSDLTTTGCLTLAQVYFDKRAGSARNEAKGMAILDAQCGTKDPTDCTLAMLMMTIGGGFDAVMVKAGEKYCARSAVLCSIPAAVYERGSDDDHIAKNLPKAIGLYQKACAAKEQSSCDSVTTLKAEQAASKPKPTPKKPAKKK